MLIKDAEIKDLLKIGAKDKILDIGGSMQQHTDLSIHTLADIIHPTEAPYGSSKLKAKNFVRVDITREKLPFKDKEFDVCLCTHTLEDLPNPFLVMDEMQRVAKRGLIATPTMGIDLVFTPLDFTDWLTGGRRVPGEAHHKWLFVKKGNTLEVIPKFYGIIYTPAFNVIGWKGDSEMIYAWKGKIKYKEFSALNIHKLIDRYKDFFDENKRYIKKGRVIVFLDNPVNIIKAVVRLIIKRGAGYSYRRQT